MLTRLNTLYVLSQGSYLSKEGECVQLRVESGEKKLLPIHIAIPCFLLAESRIFLRDALLPCHSRIHILSQQARRGNRGRGKRLSPYR